MTPLKQRQYMEIARATAKLSKDPSTKVGALVLGPTSEVRSLGYNGAPRGCRADEDERGVGRPEKYYWYSHAELNAITNAAKVGIPLNGSTIIVTHAPCMDCARAIVQAGIVEVIVPEWGAEFHSRWHEHIHRSRKLFQECGVTYTVIKENTNE